MITAMNDYTALLLIALTALLALALALYNAQHDRPRHLPRSHHADPSSRPPSTWLD